MKFAKPAAAAALLALSACQYSENPPLIFGQAQTVGLTIAGEATQGGGEFTLGYRDKNIAVIPVTVLQANGDRTQLEATVPQTKTVTGNDGKPVFFEEKPSKDAFSVLGQFQVDAQSGTNQSVGLGKFFATGIAARRLADGFACALSRGLEGNCTGKGATPAN